MHLKAFEKAPDFECRRNEEFITSSSVILMLLSSSGSYVTILSVTSSICWVMEHSLFFCLILDLL